MATGFAVLAGWTFDITALKSVVPGYVAMQPWTAVGCVLGATALWLAASESLPARAAATAPAIGATIVAGLPLVQYATGRALGTDLWLFHAAVQVSQPHSYPYPGRLSPAAAIGQMSVALALLLAPRAQGRIGRTAFSVLASAALVLAVIPLLNYVLLLTPLDTLFAFNPLALHTALTIAALAVGTLALRVDAGWVRMASEQGVAGWTAAGLLAVAALLLIFGSDAAIQSGTTTARAEQVSHRLELLLSTVKDAETGQRGYLLTGRDSTWNPTRPPAHAWRMALPTRGRQPWPTVTCRRISSVCHASLRQRWQNCNKRSRYSAPAIPGTRWPLWNQIRARPPWI